MSSIEWDSTMVSEQWNRLRSLRTLCRTANEAAIRRFFQIFALSTLRKSDFVGDMSNRMWKIISEYTKLLTAAHIGPGIVDLNLLTNLFVAAISKCENLKCFRYGTPRHISDRLICSSPFARSMTKTFVSNLTSEERVEISYSRSYLRLSTGIEVPFTLFYGDCFQFRFWGYSDDECFENHQYHGHNHNVRAKGPIKLDESHIETLYLDLSHHDSSSPPHLWGSEMPNVKTLAVAARVKKNKYLAMAQFFDPSWDPGMLEALSMVETPFHIVFSSHHPRQFVNLHTVRVVSIRGNGWALRDSFFLESLISTMRSKSQIIEVSLVGLWRQYLAFDKVIELGDHLRILIILDKENWKAGLAGPQVPHQSITTTELRQLSDHLPSLFDLTVDFEFPTIFAFDELIELFGNNYFENLIILELDINAREVGSFSAEDRISKLSSFPDEDTARYILKRLVESKMGRPFSQIRLIVYGRPIKGEDRNTYREKAWQANLQDERGEVEIFHSDSGSCIAEDEVIEEYGDAIDPWGIAGHDR